MPELLTLTQLAKRPFNGRTLKRKSLADLRDKGIIRPCGRRSLTPVASEDLYNADDVEQALAMKMPNGVHYDTERIAQFWAERIEPHLPHHHQNRQPHGRGILSVC